MKKKKVMLKLLYIFAQIVIGLVFILSYFVLCICNWSLKVFDVDIDSIIFTITNPIKGTNTDVISDAFLYCFPRVLLFVLIYIFVVFFIHRYRNKYLYLFAKVKNFNIKLNLTKVFKFVFSLCSILALTFSLCYVDKYYDLFEYIKNQKLVSTIYENYYIDPSNANIQLLSENGKKKNLIYVYLESMETTYTSVQNGGSQSICYMPNLVNLANENISFSNNDRVGGFINTAGTGWTMGSLFATTSGIPFAFPVEGNMMQERTSFASKLTNLGDILDGFGYKQMFMCGSDAEFAGRKTYFKEHGNYEIYDLYQARENGDIPSDYMKWWGYEDKILYEIAKKQLLKLSSHEEPFNLTMLTVDTHHSGGFICELCGDEYDTTTENVVSCADKQIFDFIEWCKEQDFYKDTIIVLSGDHTRMDKFLVESANIRPIYNCFINCEKNENLKIKNRTFTPMDMFPTVLSALGFTWNSDRLGLGTNLFSDSQTLAEELGFDYLNQELLKKSNYYLNFY